MTNSQIKEITDYAAPPAVLYIVGAVTIAFPASQYLGGAPDLSQNGMTFEISIKDGIIVGCEAGDGS